eukprot:CAMPEP_0185788318 /NCGR_PEP_ID=MMETSP1174-20130828/145518_1 /TAXON_ID=35687 /ORGANISM="Dictyocha speculum, Strain CCMP1381" /LENGTH=40 /DNA_ID= /DNA_START= /DNA_END= /DNA_ORIENTATION=
MDPFPSCSRSPVKARATRQYIITKTAATTTLAWKKAPTEE